MQHNGISNLIAINLGMRLTKPWVYFDCSTPLTKGKELKAARKYSLHQIQNIHCESSWHKNPMNIFVTKPVQLKSLVTFG